MQSHQLPCAAVFVAAAAALWHAIFPAAPALPPPWPPGPSHELECSCDEELRELLKARGDLEWYRLAALALAVACLALTAASASLCLLAAGWCGAGSALATRRHAPGPRATVGPPAPATPDVLASLAASEVRR